MSMEVKRYNLTVKENPFDGCPYADVHESDTGEYVEYAALRRAKAEVWRDMQYWVRNETIGAMRKYIDARIAELEAYACAAQIEEGE